ncbi:hypothetical protein F2P56_001778 [Juglans regia]|uniref:Transmembrane protein n=1 Tax=Juglans regia TaxID=51240 RepID=A0A833YAW8_JUGRE|nr:hypothetical protein F2P56_001778 [Juglans regia]
MHQYNLNAHCFFGFQCISNFCFAVFLFFQVFLCFSIILLVLGKNKKKLAIGLVVYSKRTLFSYGGWGWFSLSFFGGWRLVILFLQSVIFLDKPGLKSLFLQSLISQKILSLELL